MTDAHAVDFNDSIPAILKKFDETRQWNLPVVKDKKYLGFLSKARILTEYRAELMKTI
jgi:CIC family chloride channel protein